MALFNWLYFRLIYRMPARKVAGAPSLRVWCGWVSECFIRSPIVNPTIISLPPQFLRYVLIEDMVENCQLSPMFFSGVIVGHGTKFA